MQLVPSSIVNFRNLLGLSSREVMVPTISTRKKEKKEKKKGCLCEKRKWGLRENEKGFGWEKGGQKPKALVGYCRVGDAVLQERSFFVSVFFF